MDAAHFVFAPFLGYLWSFSRLFVRAPSGRKRFNVLGALNAITHEVVTVTNDTYINAQSVCALLMHIASLHINIPITLVLDNARYQKCAVVQDLATLLHIELLYLPSYSPNLNGSSPSLRPSAKARHTRRGYAFAYCVHFATRTPSSGSA